MTEMISGKFATRHNGLQIFFDAWKPEKNNMGTVIFCHGFKGFRNWGAWKQMAPFFTSNNLALVLFDFSRNGIAAATDTEITDEKQFADNSISDELEDLKELCIYIKENNNSLGLNIDNIYLLGHSRGASLSLIFASQHEFVAKTVLWAPVADLVSMYRKLGVEQWKANGYTEVHNKRTGQVLKMKYDFWEDLIQNKEAYDVVQCAAMLNSDLLLIHGTRDESVPVSDSAKIYEACLHSIFVEIDGADHTFGTKHPWNEGDALPQPFVQALNETLSFLVP